MRAALGSFPRQNLGLTSTLGSAARITCQGSVRLYFWTIYFYLIPYISKAFHLTFSFAFLFGLVPKHVYCMNTPVIYCDRSYSSLVFFIVVTIGV